MATKGKAKVSGLIRNEESQPLTLSNATVASTFNMIAASKAKEAKEAENPV